MTNALPLFILMLPLAAFIVSSAISERYSWSVPIASTLLSLAGVIVAVICCFEYAGSSELIRLHWFTIGDINILANVSLTTTSVVMALVVGFISFLVHLYSIGYMAGDSASRRYFSMLGFFTFAMQGIVLFDNLLVIFVFWELVGFSSYILIGHHMQDDAAGKASKKAFLVNRFADTGFIVALMLVWSNTGSLEVSALVGQNSTWQTFASLALLMGIMGKSAQFPFFTWLPDAMAGPTPVSALIHAATMVAAGVYLFARTFVLFTPVVLDLAIIVGLTTALIAALAALSQFDIKKILAYSTISQLGLMVVAIGGRAPEAGLLHLFTHAFFKAGLFLGAGVIIHTLHREHLQVATNADPQDIRNMGNLRSSLPVVFVTMVICAAALAGIPLTSGFLSKEAILVALWTEGDSLTRFAAIIALVISFLTVLYTFRLIWFVFLRNDSKSEGSSLRIPGVMRLPIVLLAALSIWLIVSINPFDFNGWRETNMTSNLFILVASVLTVGAGLLCGWLYFKGRAPQTLPITEHAFYVDQITEKFSGSVVTNMSALTSYSDERLIDRAIHLNAFAQVTLAHVINWFDENIVDGIVRLSASFARLLGSFIKSFQGGKIQLYIFWSLFALIIFLIYSLK